jgi:hypothetical protein
MTVRIICCVALGMFFWCIICSRDVIRVTSLTPQLQLCIVISSDPCKYILVVNLLVRSCILLSCHARPSFALALMIMFALLTHNIPLS